MLLSDIAAKIDGSVLGDGNCDIVRVANLHTAEKNEISFLSDKKMQKFLASSHAGAVIVRECDVLKDSGINFLVVKNPYVAFARVSQIFDTTPACSEGISPKAVIDSSAKIDEGVSVGPNSVICAGAHISSGVQICANCYIGKNTVIGKDTKLWANVVIYHDCVIGERCLFQAGAVIGSDGFGYANDQGRWVKIPQVGRVVIGNDTEIGACTTVDRGAIDDTVIGSNVIIDNQVVIAHNDRIGDGTAIAGAAVLAGSVELGRHCIVGGTSTFNGHIKVADGTQVLGQVDKDITTPGGRYLSYLPVMPAAKWFRTVARLYKIEEIYQELMAVKNKLADFFNQDKQEKK